MSFKKFSEYYLAMQMIQADESLLNLSIVSFPNMRKDAQVKLQRSFSLMRERFLERPMKSYKEVIQSLATRLRGG